MTKERRGRSREVADLIRFITMFAPTFAIGLWRSFVTPSLVSNDLISPPNKDETSGSSALTMMLDSLDSYLSTISTVNKDSLQSTLMSLNHEGLPFVAIQREGKVQLLFPLPNYAPSLIYRSKRRAHKALKKILMLINPYMESGVGDLHSQMTDFLEDLNGLSSDNREIPLEINGTTAVLNI